MRNENRGTPPPTAEEFVGIRVAQLRRENNWTQATLGDRLARLGYPMHQSGIAKIESGARPLRVNELVALARIFGVDPNDLISPAARLPKEVRESAAFRRVWEELLDATARYDRASRLEIEIVEDRQSAERELEKAQQAFDRLSKRGGTNG